MDRRDFLRYSPLFLLALGSSQGLASCDRRMSESPPPTAQQSSLTFGILSTEAQQELEKTWEPFLQALSQAVGLPVQPFYALQYSNIIESFRSGVIQAAWLGGKTYIEATKVADVEAFALTISSEGQKGYYSHLITRKDQPWLQTALKTGGDRYVLDHAKALTFAFNDLDSTSGYLVPSYYVFAKNSVDPLKAFKKVIFAGDHEATALKVANGEIDVATNNSEALERLAQKHPEAFKSLAIIWTSILIPADPIAYLTTLPEDLKAKLRNFFYNYKDQTVLNPLEWSGFEPATDQDWNAIRELKIGKQILELEQNAAIGEVEKQNMIKGLQQQLAELETTTSQ